VLETEQHLVFAKVRHCSRRGNEFDVGAERIHTVSKLANASESRKLEQRLTLIPAFQSTTPAEVPVSLLVYRGGWLEWGIIIFEDSLIRLAYGQNTGTE
jgi:hypothetical protein